VDDSDRHELITPLERALVVISHPDDAEFGAAATIASLTARGVRVDYVVTTDGGKGTEDPNVSPEELSATRMAEQRAAADVLGVTEIVHLDYPDGYLAPSLGLRRDITRQIRRFRPDLVITQNPQRRLDHNPFIGHPDHLATGEATLASVYPAARDRLNFPELARDEGLEPWKVRQVLLTGVEQPNLWINVADTFETGLQALLCHASQVGGRDELAEEMRERARLVGEPQGIGMAQAFLSIVLDR
jgi:LmbE family N-acetylglucosaminyl deacetylase